MGKQEPYLPLSQHEAEERILRTSSEASGSTLIENWKSRGILEKREFRPLWLHWVAHGVLTIALIVTFLTSGSRQSDDGCTANQTPNGKNPFIRPSETFYDDIELLAEEYPFYYDRKPHVDPFQEKWKGHPNEENEPLWATLTSVGFVSISADEAKRLKLPTARNIQAPEEYVVTPHVFHDIHCVHYLREVFWKAIDGTLVMDGTLRHNIPHYDHCFHSLRQSLTCTADLSPLTWIWSHDKNRYEVVWDSVNQCRSWDTIMKWATERNSTGMVPTRAPDKNLTAARLDRMRAAGMKMPWEA